MSRNPFAKFEKMTLACYSVIIAVIMIVCTPAQAKADSRSNHCSNTFNQEWRSTVGTSMAVLKQALTGNYANKNPKEVILRIEEAKMISLINQERAKAGLKELAVDYSLVKLAEEKSLDMVSYNYFGHISDRFGTIYDQLQHNRVFYQIAAENLAGAVNAQKAEEYLLTSPSHRWNILNPRFTKVGVGIVRGGPFGAMITQLFLG